MKTLKFAFVINSSWAQQSLLELIFQYNFRKGIFPLLSLQQDAWASEEMDDVHLHICISIFSLLANVAIWSDWSLSIYWAISVVKFDFMTQKKRLKGYCRGEIKPTNYNHSCEFVMVSYFLMWKTIFSQ